MNRPQVAQLVRFVLPSLAYATIRALTLFLLSLAYASLAYASLAPFAGAQLIARTGPHHEKVALVVKAIWHGPRTATTGGADGLLHL